MSLHIALPSVSPVASGLRRKLSRKHSVTLYLYLNVVLLSDWILKSVDLESVFFPVTKCALVSFPVF